MAKMVSYPKDYHIASVLEAYLQLAMAGEYGVAGYLKYRGFTNIAVYSRKSDPASRPPLDSCVINELAADDDIHLTIITDTETSPGNLPKLHISDIENMSGIELVIVPQPHLVKEAVDLIDGKAKVASLKQILAAVKRIRLSEGSFVQSLLALQNKDIRVFCFITTIAEKLRTKSDWESYLLKNNIFNGSLVDFDKNFERSGLGDKYSKHAYKRAMEGAPKSSPVILKDNYRYAKYPNLVVGVPKNYTHTVHIFGDSSTLNTALPSEDRTASVLQKYLTDTYGDTYGVVDHSQDANSLENIGKQIHALSHTFAAGDVCIAARRHGTHDSTVSENLSRLLQRNKIPCHDSAPDFQRPHDMGEVFINAHHMNQNGVRKNAELIFEKAFLNSSKTEKSREFISLFDSSTKKPIEILEEWYDPIASSPGFRAYISALKKTKKECAGRVGAIVMNCNPFTLGHRYLIEYASAKSDILYVFAVEEDRSIFPFDDRIALMRAGTADLPNVHVLPSGSYIISTLTFPEYFDKDVKREETVDPSCDVELFARHIAPALGISVRFVGEEPLDPVTRRYNETMALTFPAYGIDLAVIPRKMREGEPISASRVRKLLETKDFDAIAKIVPQATLEYLMGKW